MIAPASNLEVQASMANHRLTVNKTTGQVTIMDGSMYGEGEILTSDAKLEA